MARRIVNGVEFTNVDVKDPDTGLYVNVSLIKLASGGIVGIDSSFLASMDDEDSIFSPFDGGVEINLVD